MQRTFTLFVLIILALTLAQAPGGCPFTFLPPTSTDSPPAGDDTPSGNKLPDGALPQPIPPVDPLNVLPETLCPDGMVRKGPITCTGSIDEVTAITEHPREGVETVTDTRYHIQLDLVSDTDGIQFFGTAHVTWTSDYKNREDSPYQGDPCPGHSPIEYEHAYDAREWTVNIRAASFACVSSHGQNWLRFKGDGSPDGRDVPVTYTLSNDCDGQSFKLTETSSIPTWNSFSETGIDPAVAAGKGGSLDVHYDLPHPDDTTAGGVTRDVHLKFN